MIQVQSPHSLLRITTLSLAVLLTFSTSFFAQDTAPVVETPVATADAEAGEKLFKKDCAACHRLYKDGVGPKLFNVTEKYDDDYEWFYKWIKDSPALIASGDGRALAIADFSPSVMNTFPALTNAQIDDILEYTKTEYILPPDPCIENPGGPGCDNGEEAAGGVSNKVILGILALLLLLLVAVLVIVNNTLRKFAKAQGIALPEKEERKPLWKAFVENQFLVLVSVIFLMLGGAYFAYGWMSQIGVDQGYAPVQPIHYSHRIHAGDNEIDCKYCHSSARTSKTSGIPSLNVCMNCHKTISEVSSGTLAEGQKGYGINYNLEIQKLYAAVGWDEATQSYTGETKAVEWVRIHNLPDFAYFNHSQHVTVGGVECQTCHGPVEEMEVMEQFAPLTMGWCIDCHRQTNVKVQDNEYYTKIHEQLSKKYGVDKLTVAEMGGLECGKCHY